VEGDLFWFPFDHYTIVGHVEKTKNFFVDGQILDLKRTVFVRWNTLETSKKHIDLDATVTIHFSRSWCLWSLAFIVLGGAVVLGFGVSLIYRGSPQYLTVFAPLWTLLSLRASIFNHISAPTIYDSIAVAAFLISLILFCIPARHRRVRTH
jgi:hypothetical protein